MSYQDAVRLLNTRKAAAKPNLNDMRGSDDMIQWLNMIGHTTQDLNKLNIIHVAGTNGKGSTCAYIELFLRFHGFQTGRPKTTGLYVSPHLQDIRERIRLNGEPISEKQFAENFFEVWWRLPQMPTQSLDIPRYLQLLALVAFHTMVKEGVEVFVCETHMGGEFDATNVVEAPVVTVLTTIAEDHVRLLGPTIENIAWHKAGIFKREKPALSAPQQPLVLSVLTKRAIEKGVCLKIIDIDHDAIQAACCTLAEPQKKNCSLAIATASLFLRETSQELQSGLSAETIKLGVDQFQWPGRFHHVVQAGYQWYIDGAHNEDGIRHATQWFINAIKQENSLVHVLIFSHYSERDGSKLLRHLFQTMYEAGKRMDHVILSSYSERGNDKERIDRNATHRFSPEKQIEYANEWRTMDANASIHRTQTIEEALDVAKQIASSHQRVVTFVTGSLSLVSGTLRLLEVT